MMGENEKQELRELIHDIMSGYASRIESQNEVTNYKLTIIEDQVKKTNGRVTTLEHQLLDLDKKESMHSVTCPNLGRLRTLEDNQLTSKNMKKFMFTTIGATATVIGLLMTFLKFFIFH